MLTSGDVEEHSRNTRGSSPVNAVVALAVKLDDITNLELGDIAIGDSTIPELSVVVENVLKLVLLGQRVLVQQVVEIDQLNRDQLLPLGGEPSNLLLGLLDITAGVQLEVEAGDNAIGAGGNLTDESVAPVHEGDLLVLLEELDVLLLKKDVGAESDGLHSDGGVLGVLGLLLGVRSSRAVGESGLDDILASNSSVTGGNRVNVLLVGSPDCGSLLYVYFGILWSRNMTY